MPSLISHYEKTHKHPAIQQYTQTTQQKPLIENHKPQNTNLLKDEFLKEHKKNGLFEKIYNFLKNTTHIGFGSKQIEKSINDYENGNKTEEDVRKDIKKYRTSQKNSEQLLGDTISAVVSVSVFHKIYNEINKLQTIKNINGEKLTDFEKLITKTMPKLENFLKNMTKGKIIGIGAAAAMLIGGYTKSFVLNLNSIGSKEYKYDKKTTPKNEKKAIKKAKRKEKFKNFVTGAFNGLLSPLVAVSGLIVGVPAYLTANFASRYLTKSNDNKSLKDFGNELKDNALINTLGGAAIATTLIKKGKFTQVLNKNLGIVESKLKNAKLVPNNLEDKSAYSQLEEMLTGSKPIKKITDSWDLSTAEKIQKLSEENILALKFMQISNKYGDISKALKEACPTTRTIEEANEYIAKTFGNKFEVRKQLGVGTIAETYLAKDAESGKEVCIKILKRGISAEKIDADKAKFIELIKTNITDPKEAEYLIKNIDDLANGIRQEVDFVNEMNAAKELVKYTKKANVVKPIEVKDNIYVMEKANGISLKTLEEVIDLESSKRFYTDVGDTQRADKIQQQIIELKSKSPDFDLEKLTPGQVRKLLTEYIKVQTEQLHAINKNGKILHADIHPGNLFIDLNALKTGKGKIITLIDTGNTITMTKEQSKNALKLTKYSSLLMPKVFITGSQVPCILR